MNGYVVINAAIDLSVLDKQTIVGISTELAIAIEANKPIIITGMVNDTAPITPVNVFVTVGSDVVVAFGGYSMVVDNADGVTITAPAAPTKRSK